MKRWEYLELESRPGTQLGKWFVNGILYHADEKSDVFKNDCIEDALPKIGREGWELVSSFYIQPSGLYCLDPTVHYVFKREIEST